MDEWTIGGYLTGKVVMISGGPGSIGSELGRQIAPFRPGLLVIIDKNESGLHDTKIDLEARYPFLRVEAVLCLVQNKALMKRVFHEYKPQVQRDVDLYTAEERHLLDIRPGITDFSSIVFSDEGDVLAGSDDPDLKYNQVIRPWKSRLGLLYVEKRTFFVDLQIIWLTVIAILSREKALNGLQHILKKLGASDQLLGVSRRREPLQPYPPPGSDEIVTSRPH